MGAYHQMGYDSWNLVRVPELSGFRGLVLSPVNCAPVQTRERLQELERRSSLEVILDPQFYRPNSDRGQLSSWRYFDAGMDTTDLTDRSWWRARSEALVEAAADVGADAVCSLSVVPRQYSNEYFRWAADCADDLAAVAESHGIGTLLTAIVPISDLAQQNRAATLASILTSSPRISRVYLVFVDDIPPRQPRRDQEGLGGAVELINMLEESGLEVLVPFSGLDTVLWKAAGASHVATGKFLNLRRFTLGRWEEQTDEMGRVVPYWTDPDFLAWIREADLVMLRRRGFITQGVEEDNPFSKAILDSLDRAQGEAWVALAWRQYLWWIQSTEARLHKNPDAARAVLATADAKWAELRSKKFFLYESDANAAWITSWLNALAIGNV